MGLEVRVVPGRWEHAFVLATTMREADARELAACGQTPLEGLLFAMSEGESWAALYDDVVGAMFGVRPLKDGKGELWFLTGHLFGGKPMAFFRAAKAAVAGLLERYVELVNVIDSRYAQALRFAQALGAKLGKQVLIGEVPFVVFSIGRA